MIDKATTDIALLTQEIAFWKKIQAYPHRASYDTRFTPLCKTYLEKSTPRTSCVGCPIMEDTLSPLCQRTKRHLAADQSARRMLGRTRRRGTPLDGSSMPIMCGGVPDHIKYLRQLLSKRVEAADFAKKFAQIQSVHVSITEQMKHVTKDIELLLFSITRWEKIHSNPLDTSDDGTTNGCSLCKVYYDGSRPMGALCSPLCPVRENTGLDLCLGTPHAQAINAVRLMRSNGHVDQQLKSYIRDEINFLRKLRDKRRKELAVMSEFMQRSNGIALGDQNE